MSMFKRPEPIRLGATPPRVVVTDEFDEAFQELNDLTHGKIWQVPPGAQHYTSHVPRQEPAPALTALAERMFEHMFSKQDSIVCVPDELAERAWELAEAFARAHTKRIK